VTEPRSRDLNHAAKLGICCLKKSERDRRYFNKHQQHGTSVPMGWVLHLTAQVRPSFTNVLKQTSVLLYLSAFIHLKENLKEIREHHLCKKDVSTSNRAS